MLTSPPFLKSCPLFSEPGFIRRSGFFCEIALTRLLQGGTCSHGPRLLSIVLSLFQAAMRSVVENSIAVSSPAPPFRRRGRSSPLGTCRQALLLPFSRKHLVPRARDLQPPLPSIELHSCRSRLFSEHLSRFSWLVTFHRKTPISRSPLSFSDRRVCLLKADS